MGSGDCLREDRERRSGSESWGFSDLRHTGQRCLEPDHKAIYLPKTEKSSDQLGHGQR